LVFHGHLILTARAILTLRLRAGQWYCVDNLQRGYLESQRVKGEHFIPTDYTEGNHG
jgi:hypothetical protein